MSDPGIDGWYTATNSAAGVSFGFRVAGGEIVECAPYGRKMIMGLQWGTAYSVLERGAFVISRPGPEPAPIDASVWDPPLVRQALDELLKRYPMFDLVSIDWQEHDPIYAETTPQRRWGELAGPWVLVKLGQPSEGETQAWAIWPFAIWKRTGALYRIEDGAVPDDPIWTP